jgi:hypothetical protein
MRGIPTAKLPSQFYGSTISDLMRKKCIDVNNYVLIQGVPGGEINILGGQGIGYKGKVVPLLN